MTIISTWVNEQSSARAEVILKNDYYVIEYYDKSGNRFHTEEFKGVSIHYVEDAAENWTKGIKQLNG